VVSREKQNAAPVVVQRLVRRFTRSPGNVCVSQTILEIAANLNRMSQKKVPIIVPKHKSAVACHTYFK
jgi:hypothetical protein